MWFLSNLLHDKESNPLRNDSQRRENTALTVLSVHFYKNIQQRIHTLDSLSRGLLYETGMLCRRVYLRLFLENTTSNIYDTLRGLISQSDLISLEKGDETSRLHSHGMNRVSGYEWESMSFCDCERSMREFLCAQHILSSDSRPHWSNEHTQCAYSGSLRNCFESLQEYDKFPGGIGRIERRNCGITRRMRCVREKIQQWQSR